MKHVLPRLFRPRSPSGGDSASSGSTAGSGGGGATTEVSAPLADGTAGADGGCSASVSAPHVRTLRFCAPPPPPPEEGPGDSGSCAPAAPNGNADADADAVNAAPRPARSPATARSKLSSYTKSPHAPQYSSALYRQGKGAARQTQCVRQNTARLADIGQRLAAAAHAGCHGAPADVHADGVRHAGGGDVRGAVRARARDAAREAHVVAAARAARRARHARQRPLRAHQTRREHMHQPAARTKRAGGRAGGAPGRGRCGAALRAGGQTNNTRRVRTGASARWHTRTQQPAAGTHPAGARTARTPPCGAARALCTHCDLCRSLHQSRMRQLPGQRGTKSRRSGRSAAARERQR
jgi:hypothetical protein